MSSYTIPIRKIPSLIYFGILAFTFCVILIHIPRYVGKVRLRDLVIYAINEQNMDDKLLDLLTGNNSSIDEKLSFQDIVEILQLDDLESKKPQDMSCGFNPDPQLLFSMFFSFFSFLSLFFYLRIVHSKNKSLEIIKTVRINSLIRDNTFIYLESDTAKDGFILDDKFPYTDPICNVCTVYQPMRSSHCNYCKKCYFKRVTHCFLLDYCVHHRDQKWILQFFVLRTIIEGMTLYFTMLFIGYGKEPIDLQEMLREAHFDSRIENGNIARESEIINYDGNIISKGTIDKYQNKNGYNSLSNDKKILNQNKNIFDKINIIENENEAEKQINRTEKSSQIDFLNEFLRSKSNERIIDPDNDKNISSLYFDHILRADQSSIDQERDSQTRYLETGKQDPSNTDATTTIFLKGNNSGGSRQLFREKSRIFKSQDEIARVNVKKKNRAQEEKAGWLNALHTLIKDQKPKIIRKYYIHNDDSSEIDDRKAFFITNDDFSASNVQSVPTGSSFLSFGIDKKSDHLLVSRSIHLYLLIMAISLVVPLFLFYFLLIYKYFKYILLNITDDENEYLKRSKEDTMMKEKHLLGPMDDELMTEWKHRQHTNNFQFEIDFARKFQISDASDTAIRDEVDNKNIMKQTDRFSSNIGSNEMKNQEHRNVFCHEGDMLNSNERSRNENNASNKNYSDHYVPTGDRNADSYNYINTKNGEHSDSVATRNFIGPIVDEIPIKNQEGSFLNTNVQIYNDQQERKQSLLYENVDEDPDIRNRFIESLFKEPPDILAPFSIGPISLGINTVNPYDLGYWQNWKSVIGPLEDREINDTSNGEKNPIARGLIRIIAYIRTYVFPTWETEGDGRTFRTNLYYEDDD